MQQLGEYLRNVSRLGYEPVSKRQWECLKDVGEKEEKRKRGKECHPGEAGGIFTEGTRGIGAGMGEILRGDACYF